MALFSPEQLELRWQEYYELVTVLLQWIQHHINIFEERKFPGSYEEIEVSSDQRFGDAPDAIVGGLSKSCLQSRLRSGSAIPFSVGVCVGSGVGVGIRAH